MKKNKSKSNDIPKKRKLFQFSGISEVIQRSTRATGPRNEKNAARFLLPPVRGGVIVPGSRKAAFARSESEGTLR